MPTASLTLQPGNAILPDGSTGNAAPFLQRRQGLEGVPGGFPVVAGAGHSLETVNVGAHDVVLPAGIVAGDLLVALISIDGATTVDGFPAGWTQFCGMSGSNLQSAWGFYKFADGSETNFAYTSHGAGTEMSSNHVLRITGAHPSTPPEGSSATTNTANPNPLTKTVSWGVENNLWLAVAAQFENVTQYPTNYTDNQTTGYDAGDTAIGYATRNLAAATEDPGTFTCGTASQWVALTIGIRPIPPTPSKHWLCLGFNEATDQHAWWYFLMPSDYASGGTVKLTWRASQNGTARWGARLGAVTPGDADTPLEHNEAAASTVGTTIVLPFPVRGILDNFNRANEGPPPSGWAAYGPAGFQVVSNQLAASLVNDNGISWLTAMTGPDVEAYVTIATFPIAGAATVIFARDDLVGNRYSVQHDVGTPDLISLKRTVSNTTTTIGSWGFDLAPGDALGIRCAGSSIQAWARVSGVWSMVGSVTDAAISGAAPNNKLGLYHWSNNVSPIIRYDDFGGGAFSPLGRENVTTITLANLDGVAAGDLVFLHVYRDADGTSGTDDLVADAVLDAGIFEYVTT